MKLIDVENLNAYDGWIKEPFHNNGEDGSYLTHISFVYLNDILRQGLIDWKRADEELPKESGWYVILYRAYVKGEEITISGLSSPTMAFYDVSGCGGWSFAHTTWGFDEYTLEKVEYWFPINFNGFIELDEKELDF